MFDFMDNLFGPLGKEFCIYYYVLSILSFISFIIATFFILFKIVKNPKSVNSDFLFKSGLIILYTIIPYYINRLLYTMCINSVK